MNNLQFQNAVKFQRTEEIEWVLCRRMRLGKTSLAPIRFAVLFKEDKSPRQL